MPLYLYYCRDCKQHFEIRHSMKKEDQTCVFCDSEDIFKKPSFVIGKKKQTTNNISKPGAVVKSFIEDAKKEIRDEKRKLLEKEL